MHTDVLAFYAWVLVLATGAIESVGVSCKIGFCDCEFAFEQTFIDRAELANAQAPKINRAESFGRTNQQ